MRLPHSVQDQTDAICLTGVRIRGASSLRQMSLPNSVAVLGEVHSTCWPPLSSLKAATTAAWQTVMELLRCFTRFRNCFFVSLALLLDIATDTTCRKRDTWVTWASFEMVSDGRCRVSALAIYVGGQKKAGSATYWWLDWDSPLLIAHVPSAPRSSRWSGEGQRADRCGLAREEELHKALHCCETASQKAQMLSRTFKSEERIC